MRDFKQVAGTELAFDASKEVGLLMEILQNSEGDETKQRGLATGGDCDFLGHELQRGGGDGAGAAARQDDSEKESAPRGEVQNLKRGRNRIAGETISEVENSASKPQWIGMPRMRCGERTVCSGNYGDGGGRNAEDARWNRSRKAGRCKWKKAWCAVGALKLEGNRKLIRYMFHVKQHFEDCGAKSMFHVNSLRSFE